MTTYTSLYPDVDIPITDVYSFIFDSTHAASTPRRDAVALIDANTGRKVTHGELVHKISALASGLRNNLKLNKWDVVAVFSPNDVEYPVAVHGIAKAGLTSTLINPSYTADEVAYQLKDAGAKIIIASPLLLPVVVPAAAKAGIAKSNIFLLNAEAISGVKSLYELFSSQYLPPVEFTRDELMNRPAYLCYSSGTTGRSKGVETTHYNMVANVTQFVKMLDYTKLRSADEVWTGVLPFYHIYGLNMSVHSAIYMQIPLVVFTKFDLVQFVESIARYRITYSHLVPPILVRLAKDPIVEKYDVSSLRAVMSGAAPLSAEVAHEFGTKLKCEVMNGYGLTESSPLAMFGTPDAPVGSVGRLVPNVQARLVDPDTKKDVLKNQPGELWIRGPMIMKGYHNNPSATAETVDSDGYLHTGDVCIIDDNGYFSIVDRYKELIKYNGLQVPPAELEGYLLTHPDIADAAVISRPDAAAGELPRAYVVRKPNTTVTEQAIAKFIEGKVAQHKRLRGGVVFVTEIPKLASGKILRRVIREMDKELLKKEAGGKAKL
ncbi:hypothetical protein DFJ77DRAFT_472376 [Powellomyces hirtus]|nr:hypothetical protein DFJ77DRAFT_472376 [Powellomyces hirtus]